MSDAMFTYQTGPASQAIDVQLALYGTIDGTCRWIVKTVEMHPNCIPNELLVRVEGSLQSLAMKLYWNDEADMYRLASGVPMSTDATKELLEDGWEIENHKE